MAPRRVMNARRRAGRSQVMIFGLKPIPLSRPAAWVTYGPISLLVTRSSPSIRDHSAAL